MYVRHNDLVISGDYNDFREPLLIMESEASHST